jgi:hypothetical protein
MWRRPVGELEIETRRSRWLAQCAPTSWPRWLLDWLDAGAYAQMARIAATAVRPTLSATCFALSCTAVVDPARAFQPEPPLPYSVTPAPDAREVVWLLDDRSLALRDRDIVIELLRRTTERLPLGTGFSLQSVNGETRVGVTGSPDRLIHAAGEMSYVRTPRCSIDDVGGSIASVLAAWGDSPGTLVVLASASDLIRTRLGSPCSLGKATAAALENSRAPVATVHIVQLPDAFGSTRDSALRQLAGLIRAGHSVLSDAVGIASVVERLAAEWDKEGRRFSQHRPLEEVLFHYGFATDVPLKATAYISAQAGSAASRIIVAFETVDPAQQLSAAVAALMDSRGVLLARWSADKSDLASIPKLAAFAALPGEYRTRICGTNGARTGCVDHEFDVPAAVDAARLSSLVLGVRSEGRIVPRLDFTNEQTSIVYAELSGTDTEGAQYTLQVTDPTGATSDVPIHAHCSRVESTQQLRGEIPVSVLADGDYIVMLRVVLRSGQSLIATRILRKRG